MIELLTRKRYRGSFKGSDGFTLIELTIVILIIAILVSIAVAVMYVARTSAWNNTTKANDRTGNGAMDRLWLLFSGLTPTGSPQRYTRYYDGVGTTASGGFARSMSNYETKTNWVFISRVGNNQLRNNGTWKKNVLVPNTSGAAMYYDWSCVYGKIGVFWGYRNAATNVWTATNTTATNPLCYNEVTLITLTQGTNKAYYTSYRLGLVIATGSFTWTPATGTTVNFGQYY